MRRKDTGWRHWMRIFLSSPKFERALERHRQAARALDKAVREVHER